jgi:nucleotide-binding universal stress UspA family protein
MSSKRRRFEKGHKRKYLVIIDDTPECGRAVYWAAKRAGRTKSVVEMLRVIETGDRNQQWLGITDLMQVEQMDAAKAVREKYAGRAAAIAKVKVERVIRDGNTADEILNLIDEDADIGILVLAAGNDNDGFGPLVTHIAKAAGTFPIPIAIVPGHLKDEDIEASSRRTGPGKPEITRLDLAARARHLPVILRSKLNLSGGP